MLLFVIFAVDLRLVKDIRPGKASRDFEKWMDDSRKHDASVCFVLFYGIEFRLKTLSLAGKGLPRALPLHDQLTFNIISDKMVRFLFDLCHCSGTYQILTDQ